MVGTLANCNALDPIFEEEVVSGAIEVTVLVQESVTIQVT